MLTLLPYATAVSNLLHLQQIFSPISRKTNKQTNKKTQTKTSGRSHSLSPRNKDIPALTPFLIRVSKKAVARLPSKLGVQELGALSFTHEAQRKGGKKN